MTQTQMVPPKPLAADLTASRFEGNAISLFELFKANLLATRQPLITGKTFVDCRLEGPAVLLALDKVEFDSCNMGMSQGDPRALLMMPMAKNRVVGAIGLRECRFERCEFFAVGFTGPDSFIDQFLQVVAGTEDRRQ